MTAEYGHSVHSVHRNMIGPIQAAWTGEKLCKIVAIFEGLLHLIMGLKEYRKCRYNTEIAK